LDHLEVRWMTLKVTDNQYGQLSYRQLGFLFVASFLKTFSSFFEVYDVICIKLVLFSVIPYYLC